MLLYVISPTKQQSEISHPVGKTNHPLESPKIGTMANIIDWDEAMEQCGDDEEFLRELLDDLRTEVGQQITKIENTFQVRKNP